MIRIDHLSKSYRKQLALSEFSCQLDRKTYGLLGPNGSGKTTLLRILASILKADSGDVFLDDKRLDSSVRISYLPQRFGLLPEPKLIDHLKYLARLKGLEKREISAEIERVASALGLSQELHKRCRALSGGMVRRAGIAQALMGESQLLLLDEPTVGLDPEERLRFKLLLASMRGQCPIILATHIVEDLEALCDEIIVLDHGRVLAQADPKSFRAYAKNRVALVKEDEIERFTLPYRILKLSEHLEAGLVFRVLLEKSLSLDEALSFSDAFGLSFFDLAKPTLEDSYVLMTAGRASHA